MLCAEDVGGPGQAPTQYRPLQPNPAVHGNSTGLLHGGIAAVEDLLQLDVPSPSHQNTGL
jgi:hypothetical protein